MGAVLLVSLAALGGGCGIIDRGDNIVAPDLQLDEDFFYCRVQPECIDVHSCAQGGAGEGGMCNTSRRVLHNWDTTGVPAPDCTDGRISGSAPAEYMRNFEAVRFTVQSDVLSSPFYRRPTGLDSHPRVIFPEGSECAELIASWITSGGI